MLYFSRWKALATLLTAFFVCLFALPNFFSDATIKRLPGWAQRHVVLGLDLQGGSHILLEVDSNYVRKEKGEQLGQDGQRGRRGRGPRAGQRSLDVVDAGNRVIQLTITQPAITERIRQSVEQSIQIVERRVNELGTVEPSIQRQGVDRILVQVPGLSDPARLKEILGKTAKITFRLVDETTPIDQALQGNVPPDDELLKSTKAENNQPYVIEKRVVVSGEDLT